MKYQASIKKIRLRYVVAGACIVAVALLAVIELPTVRLAIFHSSPGDTSIVEGSTSAHAVAVRDSLSRIVHAPFGCGLGCSGPASFYGPESKISENYYLQIAEETGIIGIILWLGIFVVVMRRLYSASSEPLARVLFSSGLGLSVVGLLLHVWSDDPVSLTWWGLTGLVLGAALAQTSQTAYNKTAYASKKKTQKTIPRSRR